MNLRKSKIYLFLVLSCNLQALQMDNPEDIETLSKSLKCDASEIQTIMQDMKKEKKQLIEAAQQGNNELMKAAFNGDEKLVAELIERKKYDINARNSRGCTALDIAIINNQKEVVKILLENGANLIRKGPKYDEHVLELAQKRLNHATDEKESKEISDIIELAIPYSDMKQVFEIYEIINENGYGNSLLFRGVGKIYNNLYETNSQKLTVIILENTPLSKDLVNIVSEYVSENPWKIFALLNYIVVGLIDEINELIPQIKNLNSSEYGFLNIIVKRASVYSAIQLGVKYRRTEGKNLLKYFIEHGADINFESQGVVPLMAAINVEDEYDGDATLVRFLLQNKANPNYLNKEQDMTILMFACKSKSSQKGNFIKLLLEFGTDINGKNKKGETALMICAQKRRLGNVVKFLIDLGANLKIKDNYGSTAYMHAIHSKQYFTADLLYQADPAAAQQTVFPYGYL